jgi:catechol 2,3-dioxygenase-like lactoylglutathione lyase family enzyme
MLKSITPFFIVEDLTQTVCFYQDRLGFKVLHKGGDGQGNDFWAMMSRDEVTLFFKAITPDIRPLPNSSRHEWARWDAYIFASDPDVLFAEFMGKKVTMRSPIADTSDGLRAFEIVDNNGYVLCFGRPLENAI